MKASSTTKKMTLRMRHSNLNNVDKVQAVKTPIKPSSPVKMTLRKHHSNIKSINQVQALKSPTKPPRSTRKNTSKVELSNLNSTMEVQTVKSPIKPSIPATKMTLRKQPKKTSKMQQLILNSSNKVQAAKSPIKPPSPTKKKTSTVQHSILNNSNKVQVAKSPVKTPSPTKKKTSKVQQSNQNSLNKVLALKCPNKPSRPSRNKTSKLQNSNENSFNKVQEVKSPIKPSSPAKNKTSKLQHLNQNSFNKVLAVKSPIKLSSPAKNKTSKVQPSVLNHSYKVQAEKSPMKSSSPVKRSLRMQTKDFSFKILEDKKKGKENESKQDIYEFTFDPNEEPAPQKKKRKAARRKPAKPKPKTVTFKNNYDVNVNKALAVLKNAVNKKHTQVNNVTNTQKPNHVEDSNNRHDSQAPSNGPTKDTKIKRTVPEIQRNVASKIIIGNTPKTNTNNIMNIPQIQQNVLLNVNTVQPNVPTKDTEIKRTVPISEPNQSIRVEDIAADFESSPQHDIDYSPVNSPGCPKSPMAHSNRISDLHHNDDPLNLKDISFDPNPIASSSMNTSIRHPQPSPWRVEFESLPIRWHVNSYVKPNMTPAVECSFVNFDDKNKKKHVYTDLVPHHNEELPEIVQKDQPNLVQSSIISFIKEVVEKSASKKNRGRSTTPVTAFFSDTSNPASNKEDDNVKMSTRQLFTPKKNNTDTARSDTSHPDSSKDVSNDKENSNDSSRGLKRKNENLDNAVPPKTPRKKKDDKFFGFDDSENLENVSPQKVGRKKSVRQARARAVLREINEQAAPTRAAIPVSVIANKAEVERLYDEMKFASDAPVLTAKEPADTEAANAIQPIEGLDDDSQTSVHLFEDVEDIVHHLKPHRKSYGKAKKVTFIRQGSSDTQDSDMRPQVGSDEEEDMHDLSFNPGFPLLDEERKKTKKKQTKRQKITKKDAEEAEAWAAGFNSMCKDVEEFDLVVE